ncbi:MAG TPA: hypothetical protein DEP53_08105 [Bacteroidetes bacterium]|nr:hypothetical protein [Bacteroidota bacterium]
MRASGIKTCATILTSAVLAFCWISCNKDDSSTDPTENFCKRLTVSNNQPAITMDSNSISNTVSNIQYDSFGRVVSFDFDFKSTTSSERYTGNVYSVVRNSVGQITSYKATINGQNCNWP